MRAESVSAVGNRGIFLGAAGGAVGLHPHIELGEGSQGSQLQSLLLPARPAHEPSFQRVLLCLIRFCIIILILNYVELVI